MQRVNDADRTLALIFMPQFGDSLGLRERTVKPEAYKVHLQFHRFGK